MNRKFSILAILLLTIVTVFQSCNNDDDTSEEKVVIKTLSQKPITITPSTYSLDGATPLKEIDFIDITEVPNFDNSFFQLQDTSENTDLVISLNDDFTPNGEWLFYNKVEVEGGEGIIFIGTNLTTTKIDENFQIKGTLKNGADPSETKEINLIVTDNQGGAGISTLTVKGTEAILTGVLGTSTYNQVLDLNKNHPEVTTIVFHEIDGSINDKINVETGRLIREAGYTTKLLSTSEINSGGVDLFVSGKKRIAEAGAKIGVHSWCCFEGKKANELPEDSPAHSSQLSYFTEMLGASTGRDFYFFTLKAAPFEDIHYMTPAEMSKYDITTK